MAGITTIAAANRWLTQAYWPAHNAAFAVAPAETGSAFVAGPSGRVRDILCFQQERRVANDNTVKWRGLTLQIPASPLRPHFVRATVRVHEYPEGRLAIFHGPHRLADYAMGAGVAGTVMEPTNHYNVANLTDVSADVCRRARSGSVLTIAATKDPARRSLEAVKRLPPVHKDKTV